MCSQDQAISILGEVYDSCSRSFDKKINDAYLYGSYARGEAEIDSDVDFLVYGGEKFKPTMIFALAEELREVLERKVDVFEIHEINPNSEFYSTIMKERLLVA